MSESTVKDLESGSSSAELKLEERIIDEEGEVAATSGAEQLQTYEEQEEDEKEKLEEAEDPWLVNWKENDPENPLNFRSRRKVGIMVMVASIAFLTSSPSPLVFVSDVIGRLLRPCSHPPFQMLWRILGSRRKF